MERIDRVEIIAGVEIGFRDEEETVNVEAMIKACHAHRRQTRDRPSATLARLSDRPSR